MSVRVLKLASALVSPACISNSTETPCTRGDSTLIFKFSIHVYMQGI
jgi:hypothetical protein